MCWMNYHQFARIVDHEMHRCACCCCFVCFASCSLRALTLHSGAWSAARIAILSARPESGNIC
jgi:hypothetical protein